MVLPFDFLECWFQPGLVTQAVIPDTKETGTGGLHIGGLSRLLMEFKAILDNVGDPVSN